MNPKKTINSDAVLVCQCNDITRHTRGILRPYRSRAELAIMSPCGQVHFCLEFPWNLTSRHMAAVCTRNTGADERIRGHARVRTCQRRKKGEHTCVRESRRKMRTEKRDGATRDLREGTCFAIGCAARRRWDYWKCNFAYDTRPTRRRQNYVCTWTYLMPGLAIGSNASR